MPGHSEAEKIYDFWQLEHKLNLSAIRDICEFGPKSEWISIPLGARIENLDPSPWVRIEELKARKEGRLRILSGPNLVRYLCNVNLANKSKPLSYKPNNIVENLGGPSPLFFRVLQKL